MKHLNAFWLTVFGLFLFSQIAGAQEAEPVQDHKHALSILLAHDHISQGIRDGERSWITVPSFMFAYNYLISEKWAVGLAGDLIIEQFAVETESGEGTELLERSYPLALVALGTYKPIENLGVLIGGGLEYEKEESFALIRFGVEPNLEISHRFELILNLSYDIKIDAYDNWNLGFGVAYAF